MELYHGANFFQGISRSSSGTSTSCSRCDPSVGSVSFHRRVQVDRTRFWPTSWPDLPGTSPFHQGSHLSGWKMFLELLRLKDWIFTLLVFKSTNALWTSEFLSQPDPSPQQPVPLTNTKSTVTGDVIDTFYPNEEKSELTSQTHVCFHFH